MIGIVVWANALREFLLSLLGIHDSHERGEVEAIPYVALMDTSRVVFPFREHVALIFDVTDVVLCELLSCETIASSACTR